MAKEVDLKRIELKVSVNCCDGCKRKVEKALRNVQGVMKTEIDPLQPKLTVIGNVDPHIVIKKLSKVGKQAEVLGMNAGTECKGMGQEQRENLKPEPEPEQAKHADSLDTKNMETIERTQYADQGKRKAPKRDTKTKTSINTKDKEKIVTETYKEVVKNEAPPPPQPQPHDQVSFNMYASMAHEMGNGQCDYKVVEPPMPCYALPSYSYPPVPATSYGHMDYDCYNYNYSRPVLQPSFQDPVMQAGDYFSDENTTGCHIM